MDVGQRNINYLKKKKDRRIDEISFLPDFSFLFLLKTIPHQGYIMNENCARSKEGPRSKACLTLHFHTCDTSCGTCGEMLVLFYPKIPR